MAHTGQVVSEPGQLNSAGGELKVSSGNLESDTDTSIRGGRLKPED